MGKILQVGDLPILPKSEFQAAWARRSLSEFIKQAWPVLEPGTPYVHNWHIDLISEYMQAVNDGEVRRLIINIPPRHMKSIHVSVCYPVWSWIKRPEMRFVKVSYSDDLSRNHNMKARDVIQSDWFQELWGHVFSLKSDLNRQNFFENDRQGYMFATTVGGSLTGMGGDVIIIDDPQNPKMANSDAERAASINFFCGTLQTRLNNPNSGAFILIMQRLHEKDLTGYILGEELGYEHICLPSEATERTVIHFPKSKREIVREPGDLLNPNRFNKATLEDLKKSMGSAQYAGQMQQVPTPAEGLIFKREWMNNEYQLAPPLSMVIQSWDMPFTKSEGSAKCAAIVMGRKGSDIYILDVVNDKMEFTESVAALRRLSGKWPNARAKVIENKANGPAIVSHLKKEIAGMVEFNPRGSKEERALSITPYFEAGNIHFPNPAQHPWVNDLINDLLIFPRGQYKDTVDALVQGVLYLMDKPTTTLPPTEYGYQRESPWRK